MKHVSRLCSLLFLATASVSAQEPTTASPLPSRLVWGDYDGDGFDDVLAIQGTGDALLLRNLGDGSFEDTTVLAGLSKLGPIRLALFADFDGDEDTDLFLGRERGAPSLLQNQGAGAFIDVAPDLGIGAEGPHLAARWSDYDADGKLDLHLISKDASTLYHGQAGGGFEAVALPFVPVPVALGKAIEADTEEHATTGASPIATTRGVGSPSGTVAAGLAPTISTPGVTATNDPLDVVACATSLNDVNGGACLEASSAATLGMLYPLSGKFYVDEPTGNVGVGVTTPDAKVSIGNVGSVDGVKLLGFGEDAGINSFFFTSGFAPSGIENFMTFSTLLGDVMTWKASGNVGIGTTSPAARLDVVGNVRVNGATVIDGQQWVGTPAQWGPAGNGNSGFAAFVGGGEANSASGDRSAIGGGTLNVANDEHASVGGGLDNDATASFTSIGGGENNAATQSWATIGGGAANSASNTYATVTGGRGNVASGDVSIVGGGLQNDAVGDFAFVGGGRDNQVDGDWGAIAGGRGNSSVGSFSAVSGGESNAAGGFWSGVAGGQSNTASSGWSTVGGGQSNAASGDHATIAGGSGNQAQGDNAMIPGGIDNQADGQSSFAAGRRAKTIHPGSFVWADDTNVDKTASTLNEFNVYSDNGVRIFCAGTGAPSMVVDPAGQVGIGTSTPTFLLEVNGSAAKPGGGSWSTTSDARLKKNVRDLEGALETLLALRGVRYEYIDPEALNELPGERIGFLAQEVEEVVPDWVDEVEGYKRLTVRGFEALAVEALRELREENRALRQRIERLEAQL